MLNNQNLVCSLAFGGMSSYSLYLNLKLAFQGDCENQQDGTLNNQIIAMTVAISIIFFVLTIFFNYQPYFIEEDQENIIPVINPADDLVIIDCERPMRS